MRERPLMQKIASMILIWYLIAVKGEAPAKICPVIIPGKATNPIVAILARSGWREEVIDLL